MKSSRQRVMHFPVWERKGACAGFVRNLLHAKAAGCGVFWRATGSGPGARRLPLPCL